MAIPSPMAPSGASVLWGGTKIVTLPSFKLPMRMPLSHPGCLFGSDSEPAAYIVPFPSHCDPERSAHPPPLSEILPPLRQELNPVVVAGGDDQPSLGVELDRV